MLFEQKPATLTAVEFVQTAKDLNFGFITIMLAVNLLDRFLATSRHLVRSHLLPVPTYPTKSILQRGGL